MIGSEHMALDDVRVIEVGGELGAWCGKLLADMGATVIVVEPPTGDPTRAYPPFRDDKPDPNQSLHFWHYNTSKQSVTVDIATEQGQDLFRRLVDTAEVILDSNPPGYMDGLGLGYDALKQVKPDIIFNAISPFGQFGPNKDMPMTDLTAIAYGGPAWSCGYDDHDIPPVRGGGNQGHQTACHYGVIGIMMALVQRQFTGVGQFIDVSMHAALNLTTESGSMAWLVARETVQRQTGRHASVRATPNALIMCKDGTYVNTGIGARTEEQWFHLLAWLEEEGVVGDLTEYLSPPSRAAIASGDEEALKQQRQVADAIVALGGKMDSQELYKRAQDLGFQWGIVYSPEEVLADPHFIARGFPTEVEHPELGETYTYPGAPYGFKATPWKIRSRAPLLGEHNESVLVDELGLSADELGELKQAGVV